MFKIRPHNSKGVAASRQQGERVDIAVPEAPIPEAPSKWFMLPQSFQHDYEAIFNFQVRSDDIFLVTFPKSGTTWLQEAAWLLLNKLNYEAANSEKLIKRSIFLEFASINPNAFMRPLELAPIMQSPRLIKTHLAATLMPKQVWSKQVKLIYCARNPLDVAVSYYHFHRNMGGWHGNLEEFVQDFVNNDLIYTPYFQHIMDFWLMHKEKRKNIFFTTYEAMQRDLRAVLNDLSEFLELPSLSNEEMATLVEHLSFKNMKANKQTNPTAQLKEQPLQNKQQFEFMRSGIVGSYKTELTEESQKALWEWCCTSMKSYKVELKEIFGDF